MGPVSRSESSAFRTRTRRASKGRWTRCLLHRSHDSEGIDSMNSPDISKDTQFSKNAQSAIATPPPATRIDAPQTPGPRVDAKDGPQGSLPLGRGVGNGQVEASR